MQTTNEFLDAVKQRHGITSDYALAKLLGVRHTTISNYRTMRSRLDDQMAIKVARLLDMPPEAVMVAAHGERAKLPEERELWEKLWQKVAAVLILGVGITGAPAPAEASTNLTKPVSNTDYANKKRRKKSAFDLALELLHPRRLCLL